MAASSLASVRRTASASRTMSPSVAGESLPPSASRASAVSPPNAVTSPARGSSAYTNRFTPAGSGTGRARAA